MSRCERPDQNHELVSAAIKSFRCAHPVRKRYGGFCAESRERPAAVGAVVRGSHAIGPAPGKPYRAQSFGSIAAKETVTSEMIASFLRLLHANMPNVPLTRNDAQHIAAFIMGMKKWRRGGRSYRSFSRTEASANWRAAAEA
jgi:hypothetical protein